MRAFISKSRPYRFGMALGVILLTIVSCAGPATTASSSRQREVAADRKPADAAADHTPQRIILNLTASPATSQAVTWRTNHPVAGAQAEITPAHGAADFDENARSVNATSQTVTLKTGLACAYHTVVFDGLEPGTRYAYRVGSAAAWSEWNQFKTAAAGPVPFSFVYFGDLQTKIHSTCSRVVRAAYQKAPLAAFWHFVGDMVNDGEQDEQWAELFATMGWVPRCTPAIMLPGNHEYPDKRYVKGRDYRLCNLWCPQFNLPTNGPEGLAESVYFIDYQGARLVMLNGNEKLSEQAIWLDRILSRNPQRWTIAAIHQPVYSRGKRRDKTIYQSLFVPVFDKHGVDLVLQGHDHTYSRTARLSGGRRAQPDEPGTVYVISVAGPKSYPAHPRYGHLMEKSGTGRQWFQIIDVSTDTLRYQAFDATGALYDAFVLEK